MKQKRRTPPRGSGGSWALPGNGPVVTWPALAPGTWQLAVDLGRFGIHRRTVEVRACMVAEVDVTVQ